MPANNSSEVRPEAAAPVSETGATPLSNRAQPSAAAIQMASETMPAPSQVPTSRCIGVSSAGSTRTRYQQDKDCMPSRIASGPANRDAHAKLTEPPNAITAASRAPNAIHTADVDGEAAGMGKYRMQAG